MKDSKTGLTDKQIRFCEEYLIDLNATKAAERAGYSMASAYQSGYENMTKPEIQSYIQQLKEERSRRTEITADMVLAEIAKLAFVNMSDFYDELGNLKPVNKLTRDQAAAISEINTKELKVAGDDFSESQIVDTKYKLNPKLAALEQLAKHTGIFEKDNKQKAVASVQIVLPDNKRD